MVAVIRGIRLEEGLVVADRLAMVVAFAVLGHQAREVVHREEGQQEAEASHQEQDLQAKEAVNLLLEGVQEARELMTLLVGLLEAMELMTFLVEVLEAMELMTLLAGVLEAKELIAPLAEDQEAKVLMQMALSVGVRVAVLQAGALMGVNPLLSPQPTATPSAISLFAQRSCQHLQGPCQ
jgi:hypothetical protein